MNDIIKGILKVKQEKYGEKADVSDLAEQFSEYWENGDRIKVQFSYGETKTGTVGITTGWKPVFILMLTQRSCGSSYILRNDDNVIAIAREAGTIWKYDKV